MLSLYKSEQFQKEYNDWKSEIEKITDLRLKSNLENHLSKLVNSVKQLDSQHYEAILARQVKSMGTDRKDDIQELRKIIHTKLRDWKESNKIK